MGTSNHLTDMVHSVFLIGKKYSQEGREGILHVGGRYRHLKTVQLLWKIIITWERMHVPKEPSSSTITYYISFLMSMLCEFHGVELLEHAKMFCANCIRSSQIVIEITVLLREILSKKTRLVK